MICRKCRRPMREMKDTFLMPDGKFAQFLISPAQN
jgi:hypothetical protein